MIPIYEADRLEDLPLFDRPPQAEEDVDAAVAAILADVRTRGDEALREYTRRFDGADLERFEVTAEELRAAWDCVDGNFRETLRQAADNIRHFHEAQVHRDFCLTDRPGVVLGQRYTPVERVGICVPGSPVAFPSTILMNVIPARIAGVKEIAVVTPPNQNGAISAEALAAVKIAGADRVFKIGGAQAVAALAYGTETVPQVDKIVGPGNAYVAEAKKQVFGQVNIDMIAGPSEVLVLADGASNASWVAADLLSQAEHDRMASAVLVTDSRALAEQVAQELEVQLSRLEREDIARESIERNGKIIVARSLEDPGGQPHRAGAPGAVCGPALRLSQPDSERRLRLFGAVRS